MVRKIFTIPDDMNDALEKLATKNNQPVAALLRTAIGEYLKHEGIEVSTAVQWGGKRDDESDDDAASERTDHQLRPTRTTRHHSN
jgi:hypothetical protein